LFKYFYQYINNLLKIVLQHKFNCIIKQVVVAFESIFGVTRLVPLFLGIFYQEKFQVITGMIFEPTVGFVAAGYFPLFSFASS